MARVRQARAEATRQVILDGAARAFDATGFNGTSLSDVAQQAGVTKGALYFHFASKESLARSLVDEQFQFVNLIADEPMPGVQTVIDTGHRLAHGLRTDVRLRAAIRLVVEFGSFVDPDPTPYNSWIGTVRDCLSPAQDRGEVSPEIDVSELATFVCGSFTGLQLTSYVRTGRGDLHARLTDMFRYLLPGIVPPDRRADFEPAGSPRCRAELRLPPLADDDRVAGPAD